MLVRHRHAGRWYVVEFPDGTRVHRAKLTGMTVLFVPWEGREVPVFDEPGELIVQLARSGSYGLRLVAGGAHGRWQSIETSRALTTSIRSHHNRPHLADTSGQAVGYEPERRP